MCSVRLRHVNSQGRLYSQWYKHFKTQISVTTEHTFLTSIATNKKYTVTRAVKAQAYLSRVRNMKMCLGNILEELNRFILYFNSLNNELEGAPITLGNTACQVFILIGKE